VQWELCCVLIFWFFCIQSLPRLFRRQKNEEKEGLKRNLGGVDLAIKSILSLQPPN
jgi:hypothetical protein